MLRVMCIEDKWKLDFGKGSHPFHPKYGDICEVFEEVKEKENTYYALVGFGRNAYNSESFIPLSESEPNKMEEWIDYFINQKNW